MGRKPHWAGVFGTARGWLRMTDAGKEAEIKMGAWSFQRREDEEPELV